MAPAEVSSNQEFIDEIEHMVQTDGINHYEAVIEYIEKHEVEVETIATIISRNANLKEKIQEACEDMRLIEGGESRLPF